MSKKHADLVCTMCGTDIEVPMCCEGDMKVEEDKLMCSMCGNEKNIPICCGKQMKATAN